MKHLLNVSYMRKIRLDNQEMELRDYSNLKKEFSALTLKNKDLMYRGATTNGLLEVSYIRSQQVFSCRQIFEF